MRRPGFFFFNSVLSSKLGCECSCSNAWPLLNERLKKIKDRYTGHSYRFNSCFPFFQPDSPRRPLWRGKIRGDGGSTVSWLYGEVWKMKFEIGKIDPDHDRL